MSAISLKSITGITSITTPAGIDNQLTLHTNNTTERLRITSDGKVGINSTSPHTKLDVIHSYVNRTWTPASSNTALFERNGINRIAIVAGASSQSQIDFADTNDDNAGYIRYDHSDNSMSFRTNGSGERLRITSTGNIGIGENSPANLLHVKVSDAGIAPHASAQIVLERSGTNYLQFLTAANGTSGLLFGDTNDVDVAQIKYDHNIPAMLFQAEGAERLRITSAGLIRMGNGAAGNTEAHVTAAIFQNTTGAATILKLGNTNTPSSANNRAIEFCDGAGGTEGSSKYTYARIKAERAGGSNSGRLIFSTKPNNNDGPQKAIEILPDGDVLIGNGDVTTQAGDGKLIVYASERKHPAIKADCIDGNTNRANGFTLLADNYAPDESICNFGISYSGAGLVLSRGVKVSNSADDAYISSMDSYAVKPSVFKLDDSGDIIFLNTDTSATTTTDNPVTLYERLRITSGGKVGINETNPTAKLHIVEATSTTAVKIKSGTNSNQNTHITMFNNNDVPLNLGVFGSAASTVGTIAANTAFMTSNSSGGLAINASNASGVIKFGTGSSETERLRIDSNGKFCFGTYTNGYQNNDSVANFVNAASSGVENPLITLWNPTTVNDARAGIDFLTNAGSGTGRDGAFIRASNNGINGKAHLIFGELKDETYTETVRITSDGKVGINQTNPTAQIHSHAAYNVTGAIIGGGASGYNNTLELQNAGGTRLMTVMGDGNVVIGHTAANAKLHIASATSSAVGDGTNPALQIGSTSNYRFGIYTDNETAFLYNKNGDDGIHFLTKTTSGGNATKFKIHTDQVYGVDDYADTGTGQRNSSQAYPTGVIEWQNNTDNGVNRFNSYIQATGGNERDMYITIANSGFYRITIKASHNSTSADVAQFLIYGLNSHVTGNRITSVVNTGSFTVTNHNTHVNTYSSTVKINYSGSANQGLRALVEVIGGF